MTKVTSDDKVLQCLYLSILLVNPDRIWYLPQKHTDRDQGLVYLS